MHGFAVTLCDGGRSLREAIDTSLPDLVVLDLNMPEEDGLSPSGPIDRVVGLELGADDYIAKPCELRESCRDEPEDQPGSSMPCRSCESSRR